MNERLPISKSLPLKVRFFDYQHFTYPWHFHSEYEIIYIRESTGTRFVGNSIERFQGGDVLLLGSNLPHYLKSDEQYFSENAGQRVTGVIIQFEKDFMLHAFQFYPQFINIKKMLDESQYGYYFPANYTRKLIERLEKLPLEQGVDQITSFLQLLKDMSASRTKKIISTSDFIDDTINDTSRIDKIINFLNKNYNRPVKLTEISSLAAMNAAAFCRYFKNKTGKSLKAYIADMRIAYACKLLMMNNMSISQISLECGFETISHFNKTFRKITGYTPGQYKSMMLNT